MAIQAYTEVPGMTQDQYDGMFQQAGGKLRVAPGFIAHVAPRWTGGWPSRSSGSRRRRPRRSSLPTSTR